MLSLLDVVTSPGGRLALDGFCLDAATSEVHALIGERRAGKSSVARLLSGIVTLDSGSVTFDSVKLARFNPRAMLHAGIRVFHQSPKLIPSLNAWENVLAGSTPIGMAGRRKKSSIEEMIVSLAARWSMRPELRGPVSRLSRIDQCIVELARVLAFDPAVIFFDEPAGRFTADEMQVFFALVAELRTQGKAIIYAASGVDEVLKVADTVSLMKSGRIVRTQPVRDLDRDELVDLAYSFRESREELVSKNIRLLKYKRYNEEIVSNLPLGAVVLDTEGELYLANNMARGIILASRPQNLSAYPLGIRELGDAFGPAQCELFLDAARAGERRQWKQLPTDAGRFVDATAFPFHDAENRILGTILALEDVTDTKVPPEYLMRAEQAASLAELSAGIVHEVNNPLGIISNYVELLLMRGQDAYTTERLAIIGDEIKRINGIMISLLSFAYLDNNSMVPCDLVSVARESLTLLSYEAERRKVSLSPDFGEERIMARANPGRVKQVLINLMLNALDAAAPGGIIVLRMHRVPGTDFVRVAVEDDGPGIAPELADSLFLPFVSGKAGDKHSGLGLSVCRHIAQAHGGRIWCESEKGRTVFWMELPLGQFDKLG